VAESVRETAMKLKWLRWPLILVACFVVGLVAIVFYLRVFGGHVLQSSRSPTGNVTAEVVNSGMAAATDADYLGVTLKTRFDPIRHYVFGGANYGADVRIAWIGDHILLIHCEHCEKLDGGNILERRWHQEIICYDRSNVADGPHEQDPLCPQAIPHL
jgi:hypothetical protein